MLKEEDISILDMIISDIEDNIENLKTAYDLKDFESFQKFKKFILNAQRKINKLIK